MKRVRIILALTASIGVHGALFLILEERSLHARHGDTTLNLTLQTQVLENPKDTTDTQRFTDPPIDLEPSPQDIAQEVTEKLVQPAQPSSHQPTSKTLPEKEQTTPPQSDPLLPSARELVASLSDKDNPTAFQTYLQPDCTVTQAASRAMICDPNADLAIQQSFTTAETNLFEAAFNKLSATYRDFNKDMNTVAQLVETRANLTPLDASDPLQVALVAEQRRELRNEILRLDNKYTEANLLRLIPISKRIIKGLNEVGTKKK